MDIERIYDCQMTLIVKSEGEGLWSVENIS